MAVLDFAKNLFSPRKPESKPVEEAELGWGGSPITAGIVQDEHVAELRGKLGVQAATRMRRSDAQVRAVTQVISLPIRSTVWMVEEPDDAGSTEKEAAELLRQNLFGGMEHSWDDLLREACLAIYYGWRVPELVWEERSGLLAIRKVAGRNPELVERWLYDEQGALVGYLYAGNRPKGSGLTDHLGGVSEYRRLPVPLEKTLHFVYDGENENPQGFGLWRSMYQPWYIKQALYKILAVGIERNLLDVPVGKLQSGAQTGARQKLLTLLRRWRAAEDAALVLSEGQDVEFVGSQRSLMDAMPFLQHLDVKILQAGLAAFLNLGQASTGTQALGTVLAKMFETSEEANARWIEQTLNQQLVQRWCRLNYGDGLRCPEIRHKPIKSNDLTVWSNALTQFLSGGLLHATIEDEEYLRDILELPKIEREQLKKLERERQAKEAEREKLQAAALPKQAAPQQATETGCGTHRFAEEDAAQRRRERDRKEGEFTERARELLEGMEQGYLERLRPLVEEVEQAAPGSQGVPIIKLADVEVPGRRQYEEFVRRFLWQVFHEGREALHQETGQDVSSRPIPNKTRSWIGARAAVIATDHVAQLRTAVLNRVLTGIRAEVPASQIFSDAGATALEELSRNTERDWQAAAAEVLQRVGDEAG